MSTLTVRTIAGLALAGVATVVGAVFGVGLDSVPLQLGAGVVLAVIFVWINRQRRSDDSEEIERVERDAP